MDELNLYMPLIRIMIQNVCGMFAAYGYINGDLVVPVTALSVAALTAIWTYMVQYKKNNTIKDKAVEIKELKQEIKNA